MTNQPCFLPAEWAPQVGVQLTWPHAETDWKPYLDDIVKMEIEIAKQVTKHENLIVATPFPHDVKALLAQHLTAEQMEKVIVCEAPTNDTWARDHAPITLLATEGGEVSARMLDFRFNGWGEKFRADFDNRISSRLFADGGYAGLYGKKAVPTSSNCGCCCQKTAESEPSNAAIQLVDNDDFVLEGGAIESDGEGTVFTTSFCLLAPHRNQPLTREEIEQQLLTRLNAKRVVWIDHGALVGDDTDGHIDTTVRIAPDNTLLYVKCYDENDEQYEDFCRMEEQLKTFRTADGKPYRLIPLPMPKAIYDDGNVLSLTQSEDAERLPATYANFLIINGAVLVPTYNQPELDQQALDAVASAFPGREVVGIDAQVAVRQHGSLHCLTMQYPQI